MQEVLSNGCAGHTRETCDILRGMHPSGKGTAGHASTVQQVRITPKQAQRSLFVAAGRKRASEDCFGWSAALLFPLRGQKKRGRYIPFIHQVARLVARIASADVPPLFGHILPCRAAQAGCGAAGRGGGYEQAACPAPRQQGVQHPQVGAQAGRALRAGARGGAQAGAAAVRPGQARPKPSATPSGR